MSQTTISFRIDSELKKDVENVCQELGLNMTTAFTIFAKKMSREKRIPFDVSIGTVIQEEKPDEWDMKMIHESRTDNEESMSADEFARKLGFNPNDLRA